MSEFINTIDSLGDELTLGKLIDGSLTEVKDNVVEKIGDRAFCQNKTITLVDLPSVKQIAANAFQSCTSLATANLPNVTTIEQNLFYNCSALTSLYAPNITKIGYQALYGCSALTSLLVSNVTSIEYQGLGNCKQLTMLDFHKKVNFGYGTMSGSNQITTIILRSETMCEASYSRPVYTSGYIYVPKALIEDYKVATNWSTYANQFRALEDYTVDGTTTGELDEDKVNPTLTRALIQRTITSYTDNESVRVKARTFDGCTSLKVVDLASCKYLSSTGGATSQFANCTSLETLILRSSTMCTLADTGVFLNSSIANDTGYIYVPQGLIDSYKSATNWSVFANRFRAIEDYPDICGGEA